MHERNRVAHRKVGFLLGWGEWGKEWKAISQEFSGKIICLQQLKGQEVCAYGLQTSNDTHYSLDTTPDAQAHNLAIKDYPAGSSVVVTGTLSTAANQKYANYKSDGVISATAIRGQ